VVFADFATPALLCRTPLPRPSLPHSAFYVMDLARIRAVRELLRRGEDGGGAIFVVRKVALLLLDECARLSMILMPPLNACGFLARRVGPTTLSIVSLAVTEA
jgi:hypothetical protein